MSQPADIACRLLKIEQSLKAYETLHAEELAELWRTLDECKRALADTLSAHEPITEPLQHGRRRHPTEPSPT